MTNYKEVLRLKSLGMTHADIAASCGCGRNTVTRVLNRARECGLTWVNIPAGWCSQTAGIFIRDFCK